MSLHKQEAVVTLFKLQAGIIFLGDFRRPLGLHIQLQPRAVTLSKLLFAVIPGVHELEY